MGLCCGSQPGHPGQEHRDAPVQELAQGCSAQGWSSAGNGTGMLQCRNWHRDAQHRDAPGQELAQGCSSAGIGTEMLSTGMPRGRNWHRDAPGQECSMLSPVPDPQQGAPAAVPGKDAGPHPRWCKGVSLPEMDRAALIYTLCHPGWIRRQLPAASAPNHKPQPSWSPSHADANPVRYC